MPSTLDAISSTHQSGFFDYVNGYAGGYTLDDDYYLSVVAAYYYAATQKNFYNYYDGKIVAFYLYSPLYTMSGSDEHAVGVCIESFCAGFWLYYYNSSTRGELFNFYLVSPGVSNP